MTNLLYVGLALVLVLSVVAIYYLVLVHKKRKRDQHNEAELKTALDERRKRNETSIQVIARAVLDDQVSLTEASIRINTISQSMNLNPSTMDALMVFRQVAEATAHIPILDKWRELSKKEQTAFDIERAKIEDNFREFANDAAKKIVEGDTSLAKH